jgi:hypothetical protein
MKVQSLRPEYADFIPRELREGVLYISKKYGTASHLCCCGCGTKIVTPLRPTEYTLTETPGGVSLWPSIGNWDYPCQSHYLIENNLVRPAPQMSRAAIQRGRDYDDALKTAYFAAKPQGKSWWRAVWEWIARTFKRLIG